MHELETLEDAALAALAPLTALGVKTLEVYVSQIEDAEDQAKITARFPCVYVKAGDLVTEPVNRVDSIRMELYLIVGDRHVRGPKSAARGDASSPGVYAIVEEARKLLNDVQIVRGWSRLRLRREGELASDPDSDLFLFLVKYETLIPKGR